MVQTIGISENINLKYLRDNFDLQRNNNSQFFPEWQNNLPQLNEQEKAFLEKISHRYFYQLDEGMLLEEDEGMLLEEGVKMMVVSPLLEIAGFYDSPYQTKFEPSVTISIDSGEEIMKGRIDVLVVNNKFWVWVLEAKRTSFSLGLGIPQALAYMFGNPAINQPTFGILTSGEDFIFLKLIKEKSSCYGLSRKFSLLNDGDLEKVLQIMKKIAQ